MSTDERKCASAEEAHGFTESEMWGSEDTRRECEKCGGPPAMRAYPGGFWRKECMACYSTGPFVWRTGTRVG